MIITHRLCQGDTAFAYTEDENRSLGFSRETGIVHILHEDSHRPHLYHGYEEHDDNSLRGKLTADTVWHHHEKNAVQNETDNEGSGNAKQVNE